MDDAHVRQVIKLTLVILACALVFILCAVLAGGFAGSYAGAFRLPRPVVQRVTAGLILYVSANLIGKAF